MFLVLRSAARRARSAAVGSVSTFLATPLLDIPNYWRSIFCPLTELTECGLEIWRYSTWMDAPATTALVVRSVPQDRHVATGVAPTLPATPPTAEHVARSTCKGVSVCLEGQCGCPISPSKYPGKLTTRLSIFNHIHLLVIRS